MVSEGLKFVSAIDRQDKNESDMLSPEKILLSSKYDEHRYISQAGKHFHQTTLYQNKLAKENSNFMRMVTSIKYSMYRSMYKNCLYKLCDQFFELDRI